MTLSTVVRPHHVEEAIRLFKFSTMDAVSAGSVEGLSRGELNAEISRIEKEIRRRLPVGWSTSYQSLVREFVNQQGYSAHALERTLYVLEKREVIRFSGQKKVVHRYESAPRDVVAMYSCLSKGWRLKLVIFVYFGTVCTHSAFLSCFASHAVVNPNVIERHVYLDCDLYVASRVSDWI